MRVQYALFVVLAAALAISVAGCGKKESSESAPPAATGTAPAAAPIDAATAGSVEGIVKLDGPAPKGKRINMAAEPSCAAEHSTPATDEEVAVGESGGLGNVIVYVKEGLGGRTFETPKSAVTMDQKGCMYNPRVVALQAGQTFEVRNDDKATHNIHPVPKVNREWNKSQPPGAPAIAETFAREEVAIPVKCNVHPWMKSYIAVFKSPSFQVTGTSGSFSLKNLPPGTYTIEAWHEKYGTTSQTVTIGPKESKTINFVFKAAAGD